MSAVQKSPLSRSDIVTNVVSHLNRNPTKQEAGNYLSQIPNPLFFQSLRERIAIILSQFDSNKDCVQALNNDFPHEVIPEGETPEMAQVRERALENHVGEEAIRWVCSTTDLVMERAHLGSMLEECLQKEKEFAKTGGRSIKREGNAERGKALQRLMGTADHGSILNIVTSFLPIGQWDFFDWSAFSKDEVRHALNMRIRHSNSISPSGMKEWRRIFERHASQTVTNEDIVNRCQDVSRVCESYEREIDFSVLNLMFKTLQQIVEIDFNNNKRLASLEVALPRTVQTVILSSTDVCNFDFLNHLPSLTHLELDNMSTRFKSFQVFAKPTLRKLTLGTKDGGVGDLPEDVWALTTLPELSELTLSFDQDLAMKVKQITPVRRMGFELLSMTPMPRKAQIQLLRTLQEASGTYKPYIPQDNVRIAPIHERHIRDLLKHSTARVSAFVHYFWHHLQLKGHSNTDILNRLRNAIHFLPDLCKNGHIEDYGQKLLEKELGLPFSEIAALWGNKKEFFLNTSLSTLTTLSDVSIKYFLNEYQSIFPSFTLAKLAQRCPHVRSLELHLHEKPSDMQALAKAFPNVDKLKVQVYKKDALSQILPFVEKVRFLILESQSPFDLSPLVRFKNLLVLNVIDCFQIKKKYTPFIQALNLVTVITVKPSSENYVFTKDFEEQLDANLIAFCFGEERMLMHHVLKIVSPKMKADMLLRLRQNIVEIVKYKDEFHERQKKLSKEERRKAQESLEWEHPFVRSLLIHARSLYPLVDKKPSSASSSTSSVSTSQDSFILSSSSTNPDSNASSSSTLSSSSLSSSSSASTFSSLSLGGES